MARRILCRDARAGGVGPTGRPARNFVYLGQDELDAALPILDRPDIAGAEVIYLLKKFAESLRGPAILLREDAAGMAEELAGLVGLTPGVEDCPEAALREIAERLARAGYRVKPDVDHREAARQRARLQACVTAMAERLGKPAAVLVR